MYCTYGDVCPRFQSQDGSRCLQALSAMHNVLVRFTSESSTRPPLNGRHGRQTHSPHFAISVWKEDRGITVLEFLCYCQMPSPIRPQTRAMTFTITWGLSFTCSNLRITDVFFSDLCRLTCGSDHQRNRHHRPRTHRNRTHTTGLATSKTPSLTYLLTTS